MITLSLEPKWISNMSLKRLLIIVTLFGGWNFNAIAQEKGEGPRFFASTFTSRYEVPLVIGITGAPWQEDVQWSAGIRYKMAWPYELGWGDGFFYYPDNPIYRFGLMVQRSATWPEKWPRVGWEVTVLQSYIKGVYVVAYEFFDLDLLPGMYYLLPLSFADLKFFGSVGLNMSFGYTQDALVLTQKNYDFLVTPNYTLGLSLILNRN